MFLCFPVTFLLTLFYVLFQLKCGPYVGHSWASLVPRDFSSHVLSVNINYLSFPHQEAEWAQWLHIHTVLLLTLFFGSLQLLLLINVLQILTYFLMCKPVCFLASLITIYHLKAIVGLFSFWELALHDFPTTALNQEPFCKKCEVFHISFKNSDVWLCIVWLCIDLGLPFLAYTLQ